MLRPHFPSPLIALLLVMTSWVLMSLGLALQMDTEGPTVAPDVGQLGIAMAIAFGLVASLAARRVPAPQPERLGLRGFDPNLLVALVLLVPFVVVASEIDNWIALAFPSGSPEDRAEAIEEFLANDTTLALAQRAIFLVGLQPVVVEWLMRGVVLQGAIAHLGRAGGLAFTALVGIGTISIGGSGSAASLLVLSVVAGVVLGAVRIASGSILAPILLHMAWNAVGIAATATAKTHPIPGFNAIEPGHTPALLLLVSIVCVGVALATVARAMSEQPVVLPIEEEPEPEEDEEGGGFF